jgi:hypothetical protein
MTSAKACDRQNDSGRPSASATSLDQARVLGAATGVGTTREYAAPWTCRRWFVVSGSAGSSAVKRLVKVGSSGTSTAAVRDSDIGSIAHR